MIFWALRRSLNKSPSKDFVCVHTLFDTVLVCHLLDEDLNRVCTALKRDCLMKEESALFSAYPYHEELLSLKCMTLWEECNQYTFLTSQLPFSTQGANTPPSPLSTATTLDSMPPPVIGSVWIWSFSLGRVCSAGLWGVYMYNEECVHGHARRVSIWEECALLSSNTAKVLLTSHNLFFWKWPLEGRSRRWQLCACYFLNWIVYHSP